MSCPWLSSFKYLVIAQIVSKSNLPCTAGRFSRKNEEFLSSLKIIPKISCIHMSRQIKHVIHSSRTILFYYHGSKRIKTYNHVSREPPYGTSNNKCHPMRLTAQIWLSILMKWNEIDGDEWNIKWSNYSLTCTIRSRLIIDWATRKRFCTSNHSIRCSHGMVFQRKKCQLTYKILKSQREKQQQQLGNDLKQRD